MLTFDSGEVADRVSSRTSSVVEMRGLINIESIALKMQLSGNFLSALFYFNNQLPPTDITFFNAR